MSKIVEAIHAFVVVLALIVGLIALRMAITAFFFGG